MKIVVPNAHLLWLTLVTAIGLLQAAPQLAAAALTISPASVNSEYTGQITLNITGVASGQTVLIEKFLDENGNGAIGSTEPLVQSFRVTDGQVTGIGRVRNINVPGDEDGAANAQIRVALNFRASEVNRSAAKFIYKVSPATSGFTAVTSAFIVTQPVYSQKVTGRVTSGTTGVQFALVVLLTGGDGENEETVAVTLTDANGNFTLNSPTGSYLLIALKSGFLFNFGNAPLVTINAGATATQNLSVTASNRTISGRATDAASSTGIPGIQFFVVSTNDLATLIFSDANGNFTAPVSTAAGQWELQGTFSQLMALGYLESDDDVSVNTSAGNVSGVSLQFTKGTALLYGRVTDSQNNPVAGIGLRANSQIGNATGEGLTDTNGNYAVAVPAGELSIQPDSSDLAARGLLAQGTNATATSG